VGTSTIANSTGVYTGVVNGSSISVGISTIANATGVYTTGVVNAASLTTSGVTTNTSGVYPTSNSTGSAFGSSTLRWNVFANTLITSGNVGIGNTAPATNLQIGGNYGVLKTTITATNSISINCASGNYFYATANGSATTITFSNPPANTAFGFVLVLANGGSNSITWASNPKWPSAATPIVSSNTDVFTFVTDDGGTTWMGVQSLKDVR
jgi:hypothetical protein